MAALPLLPGELRHHFYHIQTHHSHSDVLAWRKKRLDQDEAQKGAAMLRTAINYSTLIYTTNTYIIDKKGNKGLELQWQGKSAHQGFSRRDQRAR